MVLIYVSSCGQRPPDLLSFSSALGVAVTALDSSYRVQVLRRVNTLPASVLSVSLTEVVLLWDSTVNGWAFSLTDEKSPLYISPECLLLAESWARAFEIAMSAIVGVNSLVDAWTPLPVSVRFAREPPVLVRILASLKGTSYLAIKPSSLLQVPLTRWARGTGQINSKFGDYWSSEPGSLLDILLCRGITAHVIVSSTQKQRVKAAVGGTQADAANSLYRALAKLGDDISAYTKGKVQMMRMFNFSSDTPGAPFDSRERYLLSLTSNAVRWRALPLRTGAVFGTDREGQAIVGSYMFVTNESGPVSTERLQVDDNGNPRLLTSQVVGFTSSAPFCLMVRPLPEWALAKHGLSRAASFPSPYVLRVYVGYKCIGKSTLIKSTFNLATDSSYSRIPKVFGVGSADFDRAGGSPLFSDPLFSALATQVFVEWNVLCASCMEAYKGGLIDWMPHLYAELISRIPSLPFIGADAMSHFIDVASKMVEAERAAVHALLKSIWQEHGVASGLPPHIFFASNVVLSWSQAACAQTNIVFENASQSTPLILDCILVKPPEPAFWFDAIQSRDCPAAELILACILHNPRPLVRGAETALGVQMPIVDALSFGCLIQGAFSMIPYLWRFSPSLVQVHKAAWLKHRGSLLKQYVPLFMSDFGDIAAGSQSATLSELLHSITYGRGQPRLLVLPDELQTGISHPPLSIPHLPNVFLTTTPFESLSCPMIDLGIAIATGTVLLPVSDFIAFSRKEGKDLPGPMARFSFMAYDVLEDRSTFDDSLSGNLISRQNKRTMRARTRVEEVVLPDPLPPTGPPEGDESS